MRSMRRKIRGKVCECDGMRPGRCVPRMGRRRWTAVMTTCRHGDSDGIVQLMDLGSESSIWIGMGSGTLEKETFYCTNSVSTIYRYRAVYNNNKSDLSGCPCYIRGACMIQVFFLYSR